MPKFPPPPRSAQKRSGCAARVDVEDVALCGDELDRERGCPPRARTSPSASRGRRRACSRRSPSETAPPVTARPCFAAASFSSPHSTPPSAVAVARSGSIAIAFISARSIITPPSVTARPATLWPPPRTETSRPHAARESERRDDVVRRPATHDHSGPAVDEAVVHGTGRVVARVLRAEDGSGDLAVQVGDECAIQCCAHQVLLRVDGLLTSSVEAAAGRSHRGDPPVFSATCVLRGRARTR